MENNEERILIIKITSDPYTCDIGGICKDKVCLKTLCEMGMTRQEAIEVMAKAIRSWEFPYSPRQIGWEDLREDTKDDYREMAEAALNALLEGGK